MSYKDFKEYQKLSYYWKNFVKQNLFSEGDLVKVKTKDNAIGIVLKIDGFMCEVFVDNEINVCEFYLLRLVDKSDK